MDRSSDRTPKTAQKRIWLKSISERLRGKKLHGIFSSGEKSVKAEEAVHDSVPVERDIRDRIRSSLECAICTDIYLDPVTLQCGHTFCLHCLSHDYLRQRREEKAGRLHCGICRDVTTKAFYVSHCLRDVIQNGFPQEEEHRRETLTYSDRQAITAITADFNQLKSTAALEVEKFIAQSKYFLLIFTLFIMWFFYL